MAEKIVYFESPGKPNTEGTLKAALERAQALGLRDVVVASTTGATGVAACELFKGFNVVVVTHHAGFRESGVKELLKKNEDKIQDLGGTILTCIHALSGVERGIRRKWNTIQLVEIIADALRIFGEGAKVCVEIVLMAADAGLIPLDRDVVAIAGFGRGADTAFIVKPVHANNIFEMTVREIVCKPRTRAKS